MNLAVRCRVVAETLHQIGAALTLWFDEREEFGVVLDFVVHVDDETGDRRILTVDANRDVEGGREPVDKRAVGSDPLFDLGVDELLDFLKTAAYRSIFDGK